VASAAPSWVPARFSGTSTWSSHSSAPKFSAIRAAQSTARWALGDRSVATMTLLTKASTSSRRGCANEEASTSHRRWPARSAPMACGDRAASVTRWVPATRSGGADPELPECLPHRITPGGPCLLKKGSPLVVLSGCSMT